MAETTIDKLSIEIESNSSNAATRLDKLARALEKLKSSGNISKAVKSLQGLSNALSGFKSDTRAGEALSSVADGLKKLDGIKISSTAAKAISEIGIAMKNFEGANGSKLAELSDSLKTLSNVKISSTVGSGISKIAEGLSAFSSADTSKLLSTNFESIAQNLSQLNDIKGDGFNKMMNGLNQIGSVTRQLESADIEKFGKGVEAIVEKLEPLSERLKNVKGGLQEINKELNNTSAKSDNTKKSIGELALGFDILTDAASKLYKVFNKFKDPFLKALDMATDLDGVKSRFQSMIYMADDAYQRINRWSKESGINAQEFMSTASLYASQLSGMGVAMKDASTMAMGYTELSYDIWARFNDQYKSIEQVQNSMQSLIAGFARTGYTMGVDISVAGLEEVAKNHQITGSINDMTQAQKEYLRYLAITDAMSKNGTIGTYRKEFNTAEGRVRTLTQELKTLAQTVGRVLIPAAQAVLPVLIAIVDVLTQMIFVVAKFFGKEIEPIKFANELGNENLGGGLSENMADAADSAKKIRDYTMGFDELNVISPNTGGSGNISGGFGGLEGLNDVWKDDIFSGVSEKIDEIKKKIMNLMPVLVMLGTTLALAFASVKFVGFIESLKNIALAFGTTLFSVVTLSAGFIVLATGIGMIISGLVQMAQAGTISAERLNWIYVGIITIGAGIAMLTGSWIPLLIAAAIDMGIALVTHLRENWGDIKQDIIKLINDCKDNVKKGLTDIQNFFIGIANVLIRAWNKFIDVLNNFSFTAPEWVPDIGGKTIGFHISHATEISRIASPSMPIGMRANGGFVDKGQLFVAREAGAEMVGSIGNRTAVANNDQIVAAISRGVYQAMISAMANNNGGGEQSFNVYLDGKQITASVERHIKSRGATIMGSQVYNYG